MIALALLIGVLDLASYRERLLAIDAQLVRSGEAAVEARRLLGEEIEGGLAPDAWVLEPIAAGAPHRERLRRLLQTLDAPPGAAVPVDRAALDAVRRRQELQEGARGGELREVPLDAVPLIGSAVEALKIAVRWIFDGFARLVRWVLSLFPPLAGPPEAAASGRVLAAVFVSVGLIVVLIAGLAVRVGMRRRRKLPAAESAPPSAPDADPFSRTTGAWEERASALAANRRWREAIRAWYHAMLVHAAEAGLLHQHRGRTNWEYVHMLSPALPWRERFEELTRVFEREWYGRAESTPEALDGFERDARRVLHELRSGA